jgi:hypothetical protein
MLALRSKKAQRFGQHCVRTQPQDSRQELGRAPRGHAHAAEEWHRGDSACCDMRGFTSFAEISEPRRLWACSASTTPAGLIKQHEGTLNALWATAFSSCSTTRSHALTTRGGRSAGQSRCGLHGDRSWRFGNSAATSSASVLESRRATPRWAGVRTTR